MRALVRVRVARTHFPLFAVELGRLVFHAAAMRVVLRGVVPRVAVRRGAARRASRARFPQKGEQVVYCSCRAVGGRGGGGGYLPRWPR